MENKKVYVIYQFGYNGRDFMDILGVYANIEEAKKVFLQNINDNIKNHDYSVDEETPYIGELFNGFCMVRLFKSGYEENWDDYLEIYISEEGVK